MDQPLEDTMDRTGRFFDNVMALAKGGPVQKILMVAHLVPGSATFINAVHRFIPIAALLPKPSSINANVLDLIGKNITVMRCTRDDIRKEESKFLKALHTLVGTANFAVVDVGGYFAPILHRMRQAFGTKLIGIVEDTENGHRKYQALLGDRRAGHRLPCPVISVARSTLKDPEDHLAGQAIVFSAEAILRGEGKILTGQRAVVFGYGKIGRGIAHFLRQKMAQVDVIDVDPIRQISALSHGFRTAAKKSLLADSDLVFCATGNKSLALDDLRQIKDGSYLFMATSLDDEMENHLEVQKMARRVASRDLDRISINGRTLFLCNAGNAVNFLHGGVVGDFISLVQAELAFALSRLHHSPNDDVTMLRDDEKRFIAAHWLRQFQAK